MDKCVLDGMADGMTSVSECQVVCFACVVSVKLFNTLCRMAFVNFELTYQHQLMEWGVGRICAKCVLFMGSDNRR